MEFRHKKIGRGTFPRTTEGHFLDESEESGERVSRTETQSEYLPVHQGTTTQAIPYAMLSEDQMQSLEKCQLSFLQVLLSHLKVFGHIRQHLPSHQWPITVLCQVIHCQGENPRKLPSRKKICSPAPNGQ